MKRLILLAFIGMTMISCGGGGSAETEVDSSPKPSPAPAAAETEAMEVKEVVIEGNDQMKFNLKTIKASAGQTVRLTLKHVGELPVESMGHNWVLLAKGTDKADFAAAAMGAKENGYVPADRSEDVIAYTETIGGGEETTIEFTAPAEGMYDFICSFPGHYGVMNGKFLVQ